MSLADAFGSLWYARCVPFPHVINQPVQDNGTQGCGPRCETPIIGDGGNNLFFISVRGVKSDVSQSCAPGPSEMLPNYDGSFLCQIFCVHLRTTSLYCTAKVMPTRASTL